MTARALILALVLAVSASCTSDAAPYRHVPTCMGDPQGRWDFAAGDSTSYYLEGLVWFFRNGRVTLVGFSHGPQASGERIEYPVEDRESTSGSFSFRFGPLPISAVATCGKSRDTLSIRFAVPTPSADTVRVSGRLVRGLDPAG